MSSVARPAVMATGLPESVPAWYVSPSGARFFMIWRAPPKPPTGMPPPITLPKVARSGWMPVNCATPPRARRKPEITSSNISSAPCSRVTSRSALKIFRPLQQQAVVRRHRLDDHRGDAACLRERTARASAASSSSGSTRVHATNASGTPADDGCPNVASPEPADDQQVIRMPVIAARELHDEVAAGRGTRQTDGAHHRFGAGGDEAHLLEPRIRLR